MDRLPTELHLAICRELSSGEMASLALCSHSHAALVQPLLYEHITMLGGPAVLHRYEHLPRTQRKYEHGHLSALVTTILSRPSFFGPFVRSIEIIRTKWSSESDLEEIATFFQAMTNLLSLRLDFFYSTPDPEFISQVYIGALSPSLVRFQCNHTSAVPSIFEFLRSHPNLSVLRLGRLSLENQRRTDQNGSPHRFESFAPRILLPNLTFLEVNVGSKALDLTTELLLRVSTHLERLSIAHSEVSSRQLRNDSVLNHLDALYHVCSARLTHLIIEDTPHQCPQSFSWIISNVLPKLPHLRILELRQGQYRERTHFNGYTQQAIRTASLASGNPDVVSPFPTKLEKLKWVGADTYLSSVRSGLSPLGASNANALLELFPSLRVVEYHERRYKFIFRRSEDGVVRRHTMRCIPSNDPDDIPWD